MEPHGVGEKHWSRTTGQQQNCRTISDLNRIIWTCSPDLNKSSWLLSDQHVSSFIFCHVNIISAAVFADRVSETVRTSCVYSVQIKLAATSMQTQLAFLFIFMTSPVEQLTVESSRPGGPSGHCNLSTSPLQPSKGLPAVACVRRDGSFI